MEKKHTPGPWKYEKTTSHTNGREYFIVYHQEDGVVADMPYNHLKNAEANARLVAAAPELLEACKLAAELVKTARRHFPKSMHNSDKFQLENICAATGKAIAAAEREV